jgi:phosphoinositide-3-kinase regulatory subunit 4
MDIFSLGCVIAELFADGAPLFTFTTLMAYREGNFNPDLTKIEDGNIRVCSYMLYRTIRHAFG